MNTATTIVAPATPHGIGGIAVIRISGPQSRNIALKLCGKTLMNRVATHIIINDLRGAPIDRGVATFFSNPASYTGEDVLEVSCHGNPVLVQKVVSACIAAGAVLAEPGEFTRRAFIHGKMDLIQAESVGALIQSQSEESAKLNLSLLDGVLSNKFISIRNTLIEQLSRVEFELDISEEDLQPELLRWLRKSVEATTNALNELLGSYARGRLLTQGAQVVLVGKPNVGKSTLLNRLVGFDRAITSPDPGTTRDAIDVSVVLDGVTIRFVDTAGLRPSASDVEKEGISRSYNYAEKSDCVVLVVDSVNDHEPNGGYWLPSASFTIFNKTDLLSPENIKTLRKANPDWIFISALNGNGIEDLQNKIKDFLGVNRSLADTVALTTARQTASVKKALLALRAARSLLGDAPQYELVAQEIRESIDALDKILGKTTPDDILNNIFGSFCVGK